MKTILVLFPNDWDRGEFSRPKYRDQYRFLYAGTDFFKFPGWLKLLRFDPSRFVDDIVRRFERQRPDGVLSSDEYVGAAIAAAVAQRLGLPAGNPGKIVLAQHKYYSRCAQKEVVPEAVPEFTLIPASGGGEVALPFPFFVKPVKGTFSLFAARVDSAEALRRHLDFRTWERFVLSRLTAPFNDLLRRYTNLRHDANWFIGEELVEGVQVTLDGFAFGGEVEIMGVVDSVMFPGTSTFERFDYPSRMVPLAVQQRMMEIGARLVRGIGITHGQFNIEMFYDERTDAIKIIEINPRLSYQFADLYENIDGSNTYEVLLDLTLGRRPQFRKGAGRYRFASSFVLRTFEGKRLAAVPSDAQIEEFARRYDDARIRVWGRKGQSMQSEMKALGSYRYGIVNVGASTLVDLSAIYNDALERLPFRFR